MEDNNEFSTVFSAPSEHGDKAVNVRRRKRTVITACLAVTVLLAAAVVLTVKLVPKKDDVDSDKNQFGSVSVLSLKTDDIKTVKISNKNGEFGFYSAEETVTDDSSSESTVTKWYAENYGKDKTDSDSISSVVSSAASITAITEINKKTAAQCGFDNPTATVEIGMSDSSTFTVLVGDKSPDKSGTYLKIADSENIYLVEDSVAEAFDISDLNFTAQQQ